MKVSQLCLTLCNLMDCSQPGSSVLGILQARILEWVVIPFSRRSSQPRDQIQVSTLQVDCLSSETPGKPYIIKDSKHTVVWQVIDGDASGQAAEPRYLHPLICYFSYQPPG